jgi:hypothetical protein
MQVEQEVSVLGWEENEASSLVLRLVLGADARDELEVKTVEMCFPRFSRMTSLNLVQQEKVIGVSNLMNLGLSGHGHHGVQDFGNVHGMRLEGRLVETFEEMEI